MRESELENIKVTLNEGIEMVKNHPDYLIVCGDFIEVTRGKICMCPMTAAACVGGLVPQEHYSDQNIEETIAYYTNIPLGFIAGFSDGFDGRKFPGDKDWMQYEPSYYGYFRAGFAQGLIYRERLKPVDTMEVRTRYCFDCDRELNVAERSAGRESCYACEPEDE